MSIKTFISDNCFTKTGGLNNRVCIPTWWHRRNLTTIYDQILAETAFLGQGASFSERIFCILNDIRNVPLCQVCSSSVKFNSYKDGYYRYCSTYCATQAQERNEKIRCNTDREKWAEKVRISNLEKYGVEHWFQLSEAQKKIRVSKLKKYGDENYCNREQAKKTNLERYGTEHPIKLHSPTSNLQYPNLQNREWLQNENTIKSIQEIADTLGATYRTVYIAFERLGIEPNFFCPKYNKLENEIKTEIEKFYTGSIFMNDRNTLKPKEIDIYLPDRKLGIELNGIYWHSYDSEPDLAEKMRHYTKWKLASNAGIHLLQVWDDEWNNKKSIILDIIQRKLGTSKRIFGRKTICTEIDSKLAKTFTNINHLQGHARASVYIGLWHEGELVSLMSFGKSRFQKDGHELIRYCSKMGIHITGGAEKMFKHFANTYNPNDIISYSDRRLFSGKLYDKLGFQEQENRTLDYFWVAGNKRIPRYQTQKHKLKNLLSTFDSTLSENENMFRSGYTKLYGCGHRKWHWKRKAPP